MSAESLLVSWRDTVTRQVIVDFVRSVTSAGANYVSAADRVAVFDNDGTLWSEKPIPIQLDFTLYRLAEQARSDSTPAGREPYRAVLERDYRWLGGAMVKRTLPNDPGCGCWYCTTTLSASSTTQAVPRTRSPGRETDPGR